VNITNVCPIVFLWVNVISGKMEDEKDTVIE
jgi:hypothetical protein